MSVRGFDAAQARYDAMEPPDDHECENDPCTCEQDARDDYLIDRADDAHQREAEQEGERRALEAGSSDVNVRTADGRTLTAAEAAAHAGIVERLSWASLHWGHLAPDALPHIAIAAVTAAAPVVEARLRAQIATEIEAKRPPRYCVSGTQREAYEWAIEHAARIARGDS